MQEFNKKGNKLFLGPRLVWLSSNMEQAGTSMYLDMIAVGSLYKMVSFNFTNNNYRVMRIT